MAETPHLPHTVPEIYPGDFSVGVDGIPYNRETEYSLGLVAPPEPGTYLIGEDYAITKPDAGLFVLVDGESRDSRSDVSKIVGNRFTTEMAKSLDGKLDGSVGEVEVERIFREAAEAADSALGANLSRLGHGRYASVAALQVFGKDGTGQYKAGIFNSGSNRVVVFGRDGTVKLTTEEQRGDPAAAGYGYFLTNAFYGTGRPAAGSDPSRKDEVAIGILKPGDRVLIASDGLWGSAPDTKVDMDNVAHIMRAGRNARETAALIKGLAGTASGTPEHEEDDRTVLVIDFGQALPPIDFVRGHTERAFPAKTDLSLSPMQQVNALAERLKANPDLEAPLFNAAPLRAIVNAANSLTLPTHDPAINSRTPAPLADQAWHASERYAEFIDHQRENGKPRMLTGQNYFELSFWATKDQHGQLVLTEAAEALGLTPRLYDTLLRDPVAANALHLLIYATGKNHLDGSLEPESRQIMERINSAREALEKRIFPPSDEHGVLPTHGRPLTLIEEHPDLDLENALGEDGYSLVARLLDAAEAAHRSYGGETVGTVKITPEQYRLCARLARNPSWSDNLQEPLGLTKSQWRVLASEPHIQANLNVLLDEAIRNRLLGALEVKERSRVHRAARKLGSLASRLPGR